MTLKACPNPWCASHRHEGGEPMLPDDLMHISGSDKVRVGCAYCPIMGPPADTEAEAITAWNRRPVEDGLAEALEEAGNHLRKLSDDRTDLCWLREAVANVDTALKAHGGQS